MLPPRRLRILLDQSLKHQINKCVLHNSISDNLSIDEVSSLLTDHYCPM